MPGVLAPAAPLPSPVSRHQAGAAIEATSDTWLPFCHTLKYSLNTERPGKTEHPHGGSVDRTYTVEPGTAIECRLIRLPFVNPLRRGFIPNRFTPRAFQESVGLHVVK